VDAHGCDPEALRSKEILAGLFARIVDEVGLLAAAEPVWHLFPGQGGITGLLLLRESHLACHTFPERGFAAFNLYCCRPKDPWPWERNLVEVLKAKAVSVRQVGRGHE